MARYIIQDHERGHRPPLSEKEKAVCVSFKILESTKKKLDRLKKKHGRSWLSNKVRAYLSSL